MPRLWINHKTAPGRAELAIVWIDLVELTLAAAHAADFACS